MRCVGVETKATARRQLSHCDGQDGQNGEGGARKNEHIRDGAGDGCNAWYGGDLAGDYAIQIEKRKEDKQ